MARFQKWRRMARPARDFLCSLCFVSALFVILAPGGLSEVPIPVLSLISEAFAGTGALDGAPLAAKAALGMSPVAQSLSHTATPLISSILALLFASMMTLNLSLMRYLRRANASSRRGVWREG